MPQHSNIPAGGPPPPPPPTLPPGAPPLPPFSPPPTSSFPFSNSHIPRSNPTVSAPVFHPQNGSEISIDKVSDTCQVGRDASQHDGSENSGGESAPKMGSSCKENLIPDLPPPPPKPVDDRTVRSIEILCQFIAKNGPEFEDMTRQKEFGNPQFQFLLGGEPGSENAVAYEYFLWMKNKCQLAFKSAGEQGNNTSSVIQSGDSPSQLNLTTDAGVPPSPVDSDMDMEDDITHPDEVQVYPSNNNLSHETISISSDLHVKDQLQLSQSQEHSLSKDTMGHSSQSESSGLEEQRQGSRTDHNQSGMRKSTAEADEFIMNSSTNAESPLGSKVQKSFSPHDDSSKQNTATDLVVNGLEKLPDQLVEGASPFRLLQDYASDRSSDDEAHVEEAIPSTVGPSVEVHSRIDDAATKDNYGADLRPKSLSGLAKESEPVDASVGKKEVTGSVSTKLKVDEFGRLIKEGASESDSDGSPRYTRRRGKRDRSRSRSRSPHNRRRKRSPWRRKDRRGRSRSFSPKRRRSRSKSPLPSDGDYPGDKMRRDKGQFPECFDFRRGKCYRGASCRYMHHEDMNDRSRSNRSKQPLQDSSRSSRRYDFNEKNEDAPLKNSSHQHDGARVQGLKPLDLMPGIEEKKMDEPAAQPFDKGGHVETSILHDSVKISNAAHVIPASERDLEPKQLQGHYSDHVFQNLDQQDAKMKRSSASEPLVTSSPSIPRHPPSVELQLNKDSICNSNNSMNKSESLAFQSIVPQELTLPAVDSVSHVAPSSSVSQEMGASYAQHVPSASCSTSVENYPAYQASISYPHSQFPAPPNSTWNSLPPPPPLHHPPHPLSVNNAVGAFAQGHYSSRPVHFQQNMLPPRNQFLSQTSTGPYITEFPTISHVGQNRAYPIMQEPNQPSHHSDDLQMRSLPASQTLVQLHGGPALVGEDSFTRRPLQGLYPLNSQMPEILRSQAFPISSVSPSKGVQGFSSENLPPGDDRQVSSTMSRSTSDLLDRNLTSRASDFGVSISHHYNPYASTFEQPLKSKFGSNTSNQETGGPYGSNFGAAYSFSQVPGNTVQGAQGILPMPIGNQYDPLNDSIEPSSSSVKPGQDLELTDESDVMIRLNRLNKPLDVEENTKQNGGETIAVTATLENEEYGETADAEVGAVEDGSPSTTDDADGTGEAESDQVKTRGKRKKSKDSRSMKLFKVALANFVKEVLKPSWRQGNMSKEAFKTIVKKTVDKVSGAMKSHHIPKSQTKINHYIDSSQRKLTKLVMGYVDKYVKV